MRSRGRPTTRSAGSTGSAPARSATLLANAVVPGVLDRYLGRTGVQSQQAKAQEDPGRRDYLFEPVDDTADHGAHGRFDATAKSSSPQTRLSQHHGVLAAAGGVALAAGAAALRSRLRR